MFKSLKDQLFLMIFFLATGPIGWAQGWENYLFELNGGEELNFRDIIPTPDGGLVVVGSYKDILGEGSITHGIAIQFDEDGNRGWVLDKSEMPNLRLQEGIVARDGSLILVGQKKPNYSDARISVTKISPTGQKHWEVFHSLERAPAALEVVETKDGEIVIVGYKRDEEGANLIFLLKMNEVGEIVWEQTFTPIFGEIRWYDTQLVQTSDNGFAIKIQHVGWDENQNFEYIWSLIKTDAAGEIEWRKERDVGHAYLIEGVDDGICFGETDFLSPSRYRNTITKYSNAGTQQWIRESPDNTFGISKAIQTDQGGFYLFGPVEKDLKMLRLNSGGALLWSKIYGSPFLDITYDLVECSDNGFALAGVLVGYSTYNKGFLIKGDSTGTTYNSILQGQAYFDQNENCIRDEETDFIPAAWYVKAEKPDKTFYGLTDENGQYSLRVDTGIYSVSLVSPNVYWEDCLATQAISLDRSGDTLRVEHPLQPIIECPLLWIDIGTPLLRRCYENSYAVDYYNEGTQAAANTLVEVVLDPYLIPNSSTPAWTAQHGDTLFFDVGTVDIGQCGHIDINVTVDCDSALLGQTHCVDARIYPDTFCIIPSSKWDGSSIEVTGACFQDTVEFTIENVGDGAMEEERDYIVIVDDVIFRAGNFQLAPQESKVVKLLGDGRTYRMLAEQAQEHPGSSYPTDAVEACGVGINPISQGYITRFPQDEGDPFVATDCQQNIGSFDPNDKQAFPQGIGEEHNIEANTDLEYKIRFQNTGTDTAFHVVIRDTLSPYLDLTSVRPGASSHSYDFTLTNTGILKFTFPEIMLPDSNINEAASHGFVQFKVQQLPDNLPGSLIANKAGIYFDFNEPVITNEVQHRIQKPVFYRVISMENCDPFIENPTQELRIDTLAFPHFDSLLITQIQHNPISITDIDTVLAPDAYYEQVRITRDTFWVDTLQSVAGCDSILNIRVDLLTGVKNQEGAIPFSKVYPNPTAKNLHLSYSLSKTMLVSATLYNGQGQSLMALMEPQMQVAGEHNIKTSMRHLSSGLYFVRIRAGDREEILRIVKNFAEH